MSTTEVVLLYARMQAPAAGALHNNYVVVVNSAGGSIEGPNPTGGDLYELEIYLPLDQVDLADEIAAAVKPASIGFRSGKATYVIPSAKSAKETMAKRDQEIYSDAYAAFQSFSDLWPDLSWVKYDNKTNKPTLSLKIGDKPICVGDLLDVVGSCEVVVRKDGCGQALICLTPKGWLK